MLDEQTTPAEEVNNEPEETVNDETQEESTEETEATIGETTEEVEVKPVSDNIPKSRLDKEIKKRKAAEKELADLKTGDDDEDDEDEEASDSKADDSDLAARLAKIEGKDRAEKLKATIQANIAKALEDAPEFKDIVNTDVIEQMAMNPANKNKTYSQLLEEVYGNTVEGKRTFETTTPRGGAQDPKVDMQKAQNDPEYRRQVLADPELKKQYNASRTVHL